MAAALRRVFTPSPPYPLIHRRNFILLFLDITFYGILNGSSVVFLGVYASRLGASAFEIGLLTAIPAMVNMLFSFPASNFARGKSNYIITRWAWLVTRIFYALLIPLPLLLPARPQVWLILAITLFMNVPATVAAVIGNAFFAETVPLRYRGSVVGTRNALLAATSMVTSFAVGLISRAFPLAQQYTIVFTIGFLGSVLSTLMLFLIRPVQDPEEPIAEEPTLQAARGGFHLEILKGKFSRVLLIMFIFQCAVFWVNPLVPIYQTRQLLFTDLIISQGTSVFWVVYFLSSTQSGALARRLGFKRLLALGTLGSSLALLIFTYSYHPWVYMVCQIISGLSWAWIGGGTLNYVLERVPPEDRPSHLAWYNTAINSAILICGLLAPLTLNITGLAGGMLLGTVFRATAAFVVYQWG